MDIGEIEFSATASMDGVWKPLTIGDIEVKLRSPLLPAYLDAEDEAFAAARKRYGVDLPPRRRIDAKATAIVNAALIDWRNISSNGKPVAFSPEKARELFLGEMGFKDAKEALCIVFAGQDAFLKQNVDDDQKKSKPTSLSS